MLQGNLRIQRNMTYSTNHTSEREAPVWISCMFFMGIAGFSAMSILDKTPADHLGALKTTLPKRTRNVRARCRLGDISNGRSTGTVSSKSMCAIDTGGNNFRQPESGRIGSLQA